MFSLMCFTIKNCILSNSETNLSPFNTDYNYGKKKKKAVGQPRLNSEEAGPKLPMKRGRKKKRFHLIQKKKSHPSQSSNYFYNRREPRDEGFIDDDRAIDYDYYEEGLY